jgi:hypothetical protein
VRDWRKGKVDARDATIWWERTNKRKGEERRVER